MRTFCVILSACLMLASTSSCCAMTAKQRAENALEDMRAEQYFTNAVQAKFVTAIGKNDNNAANELLAQGAEVNAFGDEGITPLIWALLKQQIGSVEFLLGKGADPNQVTRWTNELGREEWASPLSVAAKFENERYLEALLAEGANPNLIVNAVDETALFTASLHRRFRNMELLIAKGADVNHRSQFGYTPVLDAVLGRVFSSALVLLNAGANPRLQNANRQSAMSILQHYGNRGVVIGSEDAAAYLKLTKELKRRGYLPE